MKPKVFSNKNARYQRSGPKDSDKEKWKEIAEAHKNVFENSTAGDTTEGEAHKCFIPMYYMEIEIQEQKDKNGKTTRHAERKIICPRKTTQTNWFKKYLRQGMPGIENYDWIINPQDLYEKQKQKKR